MQPSFLRRRRSYGLATHHAPPVQTNSFLYLFKPLPRLFCFHRKKPSLAFFSTAFENAVSEGLHFQSLEAIENGGPSWPAPETL